LGTRVSPQKTSKKYIVQSLPGSIELERGRSKKGKDDKDIVHKVWKKGYNRRKSAGMRKE